MKICLFLRDLSLPPRSRGERRSSGLLRSEKRPFPTVFFVFLIFEDGTDRFSLNVGKKLPLPPA